MASEAAPVGVDEIGRRADPRARLVGYACGVLLLGAAVWAVSGHDLDATWEAVRRAPAGLVAAALLLPLANWVLMSATFGALMRPLGRVGGGEMAALIGASWLLNYLPLRPGLVGRVAYHKVVNGIAVRESLRAIAGNVAGGFVAMGAAIAIAGVLSGGYGRGIPLWAVIVSPVVPLAGAAAAAGLLGRPVTRSWAVASTFRYLDLLVWAIRYAVVFRIVGREVDAAGVLAIAAVSQAASLVPIAGNGLGLREWAVGLTAAALPSWMSDGSDLAQEVGLAADLANRGAEVCAAVPVGVVSVWSLARRRASALRCGRDGGGGRSSPGAQ